MKFKILNVCIKHWGNKNTEKVAEWAGNVKQNEKGISLLNHNICGLFFSFPKSSIFLSDRICKLWNERFEIIHIQATLNVCDVFSVQSDFF